MNDDRAHHLAGTLMALGAFMILPMGDAFVKTMSGLWPGTAIAALRYALALPILAVLVWRTEGRGVLTCPRPWLQLGRGAAMSGVVVTFFAGVQLMPLVEMTAISFCSPMILALLSALILKERMSRTAWLAIAIAFPGMLLILKPNIANLGWAALLPVISATCFAFTMIFNRMAAGSGSALKMQLLAAAFCFPIILAVTLAGAASGVPSLAVPMPGWSIIARCAAIAVTGTVSHFLLFKATERVSPTRIAPLTYSQLLMATALGALLFGEWPDVGALAGAIMIIGAGLFLWRQGRGSGLN